MKKAFINGEIFTGNAVLSGYTLYCEGDYILDVKDASPCDDYDGEIIDCTNKRIAPGFIDIQVNGGGGVLFNDDTTVEGIQTIMKAHQQFGTVALLPTLISDSHEKIKAAIAATNEAIANNIPGVLGIHLEGPFLNANRKGVHNPLYFTPLGHENIPMLCGLNKGITLVTIAPEQSSSDVIKQLSANGIHVFAGHTDATYEQTKNALENGLTGFTHLFNAMTPMHSREPGVVGAALEDHDSWCGIIVDGYHVNNATLKVAIAAKAPRKMLLVTDAMPTVGTTEKQFMLYGEEIMAHNGRCATPAGTLAGSDLDMMSAVKNTVNWLDIEWPEAIRMASTYPAECLGIDNQYGYLTKGHKAAFIIIDEALNLDSVWVNSQCVEKL